MTDNFKTLVKKTYEEVIEQLEELVDECECYECFCESAANILEHDWTKLVSFSDYYSFEYDFVEEYDNKINEFIAGVSFEEDEYY